MNKSTQLHCDWSPNSDDSVHSLPKLSLAQYRTRVITPAMNILGTTFRMQSQGADPRREEGRRWAGSSRKSATCHLTTSCRAPVTSRHCWLPPPIRHPRRPTPLPTGRRRAHGRSKGGPRRRHAAIAHLTLAVLAIVQVCFGLAGEVRHNFLANQRCLRSDPTSSSRHAERRFVAVIRYCWRCRSVLAGNTGESELHTDPP